MQQYEATLDPNYVADHQWEQNELQWEKEDAQWENEEMQQRIDQLEAKWIRGQQALHGSTQTDRLNEPPLQNSTAIGGGSGQSRRPGLTLHRTHTVYVPPTELADRRQTTTLHSDSTLKNPYTQLGPRERTNMPLSEMQEIDVTMAAAMRKVHIHQFVVSTWRWNRWRYDFEVAMKGQTFPRKGGLQFCLATLMIHLEMRMKKSQRRDTAIRHFPGVN